MKKYLILFLLLIFSTHLFAAETTSTENNQNPDEIKTEEPISVEEKQKSKKKKERYAPKMDFDMKFALPSVLGFVAGNNGIFALQDTSETIPEVINLMVETRFDTFSAGDFFFTGSFGFSGHANKDPNIDNFSLNLSLGYGFYINPFRFSNLSMSGFSFFLYPMYDVPIIKNHSYDYFNWKFAADIGYNFVFLNVLSVYPYYRYIVSWQDTHWQQGFDFGFFIGLYMMDSRILFSKNPEVYSRKNWNDYKKLGPYKSFAEFQKEK